VSTGECAVAHGLCRVSIGAKARQHCKGVAWPGTRLGLEMGRDLMISIVDG
jgi:hypothetical protein